MTDHEILVAAKTRLLIYGWNHHGWGDMRGDGPGCMLTACIRVSARAGRSCSSATAVLREVVGGTIIPFNEAPERTFEQIIDAFDRAILATAPPLPIEPRPSDPQPALVAAGFRARGSHRES